MSTFLGLPKISSHEADEARDPAGASGHADHPPRMGFFTDTSVCIGCKACEVACKEWNSVPEDGLDLTGMSYDNTQSLGASTWRHVAFIEQPASSNGDSGGAENFRWLMSSDVCKHCTHAACLDVCPTGALVRTEFGTVVVQPDVCNGCGYCVPACPYGVIDIRKEDGRAFKCTMCYDRLQVGLEPACAKTCPTESIQFGELDELRERRSRPAASRRPQARQPRLYGESPDDGVGGQGAFFLLLDEPEVYGLPPAPVVTTRDLPRCGGAPSLAAATLLAARSPCTFAGRDPTRGTPQADADEAGDGRMVPRGRLPVVLRPTDPQAADVGTHDIAGLPCSWAALAGAASALGAGGDLTVAAQG